MAKVSTKVQNLGSFAWSIADILRGDFKQSEYGKVILPFIVMRRLDCILEASKDADRLRELRSALITAAVTGQIDVASWGKRGDTDRRLDAIEQEMAS